MTLISVDKEKCTRCGLCAVPCRLVYFKEGGYPRQLPMTDDICMRCGHCVGYCPTGALTHKEMPDLLKIDESLKVSFAQCAQLIKSRRSIREYQDKAVPQEEIDRIIEVARYAPTGHNSQGVRWLVVNDRAKIKEIAKVGADWLRFTIKSNPRMEEMFKGIVEELDRGKDEFLQGAPAIALTYAPKNNPISQVDCIIAMSYFDLVANTAGLGCCWGGFLLMAASSYPDLMKILALPEGYTPYAGMMFGYPKYQYTYIPGRKSADIVYL